MTHTAEVGDVYQLTPTVKGFRLRVPGHEFDFEPGQHTTIRFGSGGEAVVRPYTPTNLPGSDELALTIKRYDDGVASSCMHTKRPGDVVEIGPLRDDLTLADPDRDSRSLKLEPESRRFCPFSGSTCAREPATHTSCSARRRSRRSSTAAR